MLAANTDKLDLSGLLNGEHADAVSLDAYLDFSFESGNTTIDVRPTGATGPMTQQIVLVGVNLTTIGNDADIIVSLLSSGKLLTDI